MQGRHWILVAWIVFLTTSLILFLVGEPIAAAISAACALGLTHQLVLIFNMHSIVKAKKDELVKSLTRSKSL